MPEDNKKEMAVIAKEDFSTVAAKAIANLLGDNRLEPDSKVMVLMIGTMIAKEIETVLFTTDEKEKENV